jgi:hypothetical protein
MTTVCRIAVGLAFGLVLLWGSAAAQPTYPEGAQGESQISLETGVVHWLTARAPLAGFAPVAVGVGFGHRIGRARLAWRLQWITDAFADRPVSFVHVDLLSVEKLFSEGSLRPYWRIALGAGIDLVGDAVNLGSDGYFNRENGASAGLSLSFGSGLDVMITDGVFARVEAIGRVHGGAGRTGVTAGLNGGVGLAY